MNVFKVHRGIRDVGISYGLPVFFIDFGPGLSLEPEGVIEKMLGLGFLPSTWVILRNNPLKQKGLVVLVKGIIACKGVIEIEDDGTNNSPAWFTDVTRWMVYWRPDITFNLGALRNKQDMVLLQSNRYNELDKYLLDTYDLACLKAVIVNEDKKQEAFDRVKDYGVRIYVK